MARRRRLSAEAHTEDRVTAAYLAHLTRVLYDRHPNTVGLTMALRGLEEFASSAAPAARKRSAKKPPAVSTEALPLTCGDIQ